MAGKARNDRKVVEELFSYFKKTKEALKRTGEGILAEVGLLLACSLSTCLPRLWVDDNKPK